uniref:Uncharacterized protein n=1 Tax=Chromera velia CCMP2878 TaxID=1169474 RepID=A0A0G4I9F0_9ALVE|eukprot:Cvel_12217.t1-p1 / transcript=Cvel_12217.t1 / gene=Cvel_12217 / organism=Chromera_velia_CCMP2878 / gene_product=hypothetical protein / transcript_product=hypothetical protein / location=Cvel_scaffold790:60190-61059(+) / protein_length=290 / sequence_SO=supercontig / SO=protein_coding / is_pseudo=false
MAHYNLDNLDVACKQSLEALLKPKYLSVIEPWMVNASNRQKRVIEMIGGVVGCNCVRSRRLETQHNTWDLMKSTANTGNALDKRQDEKFDRSIMCQYGLIQGGHPPVTSPVTFRNRNDLEASYVLENKKLTDESFSSILAPKALRKLLEWQIYEGSQAQRSAVVDVLTSIKSCIALQPNYRTHTLSNMHDDPAYQRLWQHSKDRNALRSTLRTTLYASQGIMSVAAQLNTPMKEKTSDPMADEVARQRIYEMKARAFRNFKSNLCLPWRGQDLRSSYQRDYCTPKTELHA